MLITLCKHRVFPISRGARAYLACLGEPTKTAENAHGSDSTCVNDYTDQKLGSNYLCYINITIVNILGLHLRFFLYIL